VREKLALAVLAGLFIGCEASEGTEETPAPPEPVPGVEVELLPACAEPGETGWDDLAPGSGIDFVHARGDWPDAGEDVFQQLRSMGAGLVAADLSGDELPDLLLTSTEGPNELWLGAGDGTFELAVDTGLELGDVLTYAASAADYDADGLLDVAIGGLDDLRLFRALGDGGFEEVTAEVGLSTGEGIAQCLAWADLDQDGDLDLYAGSFPIAPYPMMSNPGNDWDGIWLQGDDGRFEDHADDLYREASTDGACTVASWRDIDDDGDVDLLQLNDYGPFHNAELWINHGLEDDGSLAWTDALPTTGIGTLSAPMGASIVDLDGDDVIDLWIGDRTDNRVFQGLGELQFVDVGLVWRQDVPDTPGLVSWTVRPVDLDGDGRTEVFVVYGPFEEVPSEPILIPEQPNRLWAPDPPGSEAISFHEEPEAIPGFSGDVSRAAGEADFDRDGIPDMVVGNLDAAPYLYRTRCTDNRRLVVELRDPTSRNLYAIGARVTVQAGPLLLRREVAAGGQGTFSSSEPALFFGVGQHPVDRVTVRWPDGEELVIPTPCDHCRIRVTRDG